MRWLGVRKRRVADPVNQQRLLRLFRFRRGCLVDVLDYGLRRVLAQPPHVGLVVRSRRRSFLRGLDRHVRVRRRRRGRGFLFVGFSLGDQWAIPYGLAFIGGKKMADDFYDGEGGRLTDRFLNFCSYDLEMSIFFGLLVFCDRFSFEA